MTRYPVRLVVLIFALGIFAGCTVCEHRRQIRAGLQTNGHLQKAYLAEWGVPKSTYMMTSNVEAARFGWGFGEGFFSKGRVAVEVWEYPDRGVALAFSRGRLVSWKNPGTPAPEKRAIP